MPPFVFPFHGPVQRFAIGVFIAVAAAGELRAQVTLYEQRWLDRNNDQVAVEPAIVAAQDSMGDTVDVVGAWVDWRLYPDPQEVSRLGTAISLTGGVSYLPDALVYPPTQLNPLQPDRPPNQDPFVAWDPAHSYIWIGGSAFNPGLTNGIYIIRKIVGASSWEWNPPARFITFNSSVPPPPPAPFYAVSDDKPLAAAGPHPQHPNDPNYNMLYVAFMRRDDAYLGSPPPTQGYTCPNFHLALARSEDRGATWPANQIRAIAPSPHPTPQFPYPCHYAAWGPWPLVVSTGAHTGRLLVFFKEWWPEWQSYVPPRYLVIRSDDRGDTWAPHTVLFPGVDPLAADPDLPGPFRENALPSVAFDPLSGHIYAIIAGRSGLGARNIDLWLTRSTDAGVTFEPPIPLPLDNGPYDPVDGPDQFMPSLRVDPWGGVNLHYYDTYEHHITENLDDGALFAWLEVRFTRITGITSAPLALSVLQYDNRKLTRNRSVSHS